MGRKSEGRERRRAEGLRGRQPDQETAAVPRSSFVGVRLPSVRRRRRERDRCDVRQCSWMCKISVKTWARSPGSVIASFLSRRYAARAPLMRRTHKPLARCPGAACMPLGPRSGPLGLRSGWRAARSPLEPRSQAAMAPRGTRSKDKTRKRRQERRSHDELFSGPPRILYNSPSSAGVDGPSCSDPCPWA